MRACLAVIFCCIPLSFKCASAQADDVAAAAQQVLSERCFSCHGESGANEGGFNYALNRKHLVRELVVPGSPEESKLFQRISSGEMPPDGDRLTEEEVQALKVWIAADAPAFTVSTERDLISPNQMEALILDDLEGANERNRPFYRYFTLTHLFNAGFEDNELESHRQGLTKLVNSLSWGREIRIPVAIDPHKTILRIDLRHYKWQLGAWDQIIAANPYLVSHSSPSQTRMCEITKCNHPHARGDWFVYSASRPPLYNLLLELPDTPAKFVAFEKERLGVDVVRNLSEQNDVIRAGFYPSGVSKSNRLIERHTSAFGAYWKSYDFKPVDVNEVQPRRRNIKAHPTGPEGEVGFEHDGGEMIFNLPNGLQGYLLTDAKNQAIERGPTDVVVDKEAVKRGRDPEVINGVSCMNCHWSGTLNKSDQIRNHVLAQPAGAYPEDILDFVRSVYVEKSEFDARLLEDRERFEAAVRKCGAQLSKSEPVATLAFQFEEPLDLDQAAAEVGVTPQKLIEMLKEHQGLARQLGSLSLGQPVPRETFVQQYPQLIQTLGVGKFIPRQSRLKRDLASIEQAPAPGSPGPGTPGPTPKSPRPGSTNSPAGPADPFQGNDAGEQREFSEFKIPFRWCPPGIFTMGTPGAVDHEASADASITRGFWLAETELTEIQWHKVMKTAPWRGQPSTIDEAAHPVIYVSHGDNGGDTYSPDSASEYCRRLTQAERAAGRLPAGWHFGLPTEAQWEYACRAGTESEYFFGDDATRSSEFAWCSGNIGGQTAQTVGQKTPNAWGLHDMTGNVREWCADGYRSSLPGGRNPFVGFSPSNSSPRICRGSSWKDSEAKCRSGARGMVNLGTRSGDIGFRLCLFTPGRPRPSNGGSSVARSENGIPIVPQDNYVDPHRVVNEEGYEEEMDVITSPDLGDVLENLLNPGGGTSDQPGFFPGGTESDEDMELPESDECRDSTEDEGDSR